MLFTVPASSENLAVVFDVTSEKYNVCKLKETVVRVTGECPPYGPERIKIERDKWLVTQPNYEIIRSEDSYDAAMNAMVGMLQPALLVSQ
jgi:spore coat polysaccharide biosynthesis protein SpsF (cytidylyltransferase family)